MLMPGMAVKAAECQESYWVFTEKEGLRRRKLLKPAV